MRKKSNTSGVNPPASTRRVLILDDHPIMLLGIAQLIDAEPDLEICGKTGSVAEALAMMTDSSPDLLVTDLSLPEKHGLELVKDMQALYPDCPILVLSMHDESLYAERVLRAGARGYLMKKTAAENLIAAIHCVLGGEIYLSKEMSKSLIETLSRRKKSTGNASMIDGLTDRELEIFELIGTGKSSRQIADQLHISIRTVDAHRAHIKDKLRLTDSTALVHHAVSWVELQDQR